MDIFNCSTALFVKDIEISKLFYINVLGFAVRHDFGKNIIFENGVAIWEIEPSHIIPQKLGTERLMDRSVNKFELYFETENLAEVYDRLKAMNVEFLHGIHKENWGQNTIRFYDPDHHLIEVGDSMNMFLNGDVV